MASPVNKPLGTKTASGSELNVFAVEFAVIAAGTR
jgi:hypothetical protein